MVVALVSRNDPDPAKDALLLKRGHVIAVVPDELPWTDRQKAAALLGKDNTRMNSLRTARTVMVGVDDGLVRAVDAQVKQAEFLAVKRDAHPGETHPHFWSDSELDNPQWIIVKVPGVSEDAMSHFMSPAVVNDATATGINAIKQVAHRAAYLDLTKIPQLDKLDGTKNVRTVTVPRNVIDSAMVLTPLDLPLAIPTVG